MNCAPARIALLDADLPIGDDSSELAHHLRHCDACARIAAAITRDISSLSASVRRRARRRRRVAVAAVASTIAAAAIVAAIVRVNSRVVDTPRAVNAAPTGIVSVEVPPGKIATVLQTRDPNVTIVWLSNEAGGGL